MSGQEFTVTQPRSSRAMFDIAGRILQLAGIVLIAAAGAKVFATFYSPTGVSELTWLPERGVILLSIIEANVGIFLFFKLDTSKAIVYINAILHLLLGAVSLSYLLAGNETCGCFGNLHLHPAWFLTWDAIVVASSFVLLVHSDEYFDGRVLKNTIGFLASLTISCCVGLVVSSPGGRFLFGATRHVDIVNFDRGRTLDLGELEPGKVVEKVVEVRNSSTTSVVISSGGTSCGCITLNDFPLVLPPQASTKLLNRILASDKPGRYAKYVDYFLREGGHVPFSIIFSVKDSQ